eukprot:2603172-Rhodomonas_salina.1
MDQRETRRTSWRAMSLGAPKHTIVLLQETASKSTRTFSDFESVSDAMNGICQLYEQRLKQMNPARSARNRAAAWRNQLAACGISHTTSQSCIASSMSSVTCVASCTTARERTSRTTSRFTSSAFLSSWVFVAEIRSWSTVLCLSLIPCPSGGAVGQGSCICAPQAHGAISGESACRLPPPLLLSPLYRRLSALTLPALQNCESDEEGDRGGEGRNERATEDGAEEERAGEGSERARAGGREGGRAGPLVGSDCVPAGSEHSH